MLLTSAPVYARNWLGEGRGQAEDRGDDGRGVVCPVGRIGS